MSISRRGALMPAFASAWLLSVGACDDGPRPISEVRTVEAGPVNKTTSGARFGFDARESSLPHSTPESPYAWELPAEWRSLPPGPMRAASIAVTAAPEIDCSVTILPAGGGGVAANLNRWRRQMSLGDLSTAELAALPTLSVLGEKAVRLESDGVYRGMGTTEPLADARLLGLAVEHQGRAIFVKMVGPKVQVDRERQRFDAFCRSIAVAAVDPHAGIDMHAPAPGAAPTPGTAPQAWEVPSTWRQVRAGSMRLVSFEIGPNGEAEAYVVVLSGNGGGLEANINRWRQQMAQPALTTAEIAALRSIPMLGRQGRLVAIHGNFTDMDGSKQADAMMLGAVCELPEQSVFVKMVGPASTVAAEEERFAIFCRSLQ